MKRNIHKVSQRGTKVGMWGLGGEKGTPLLALAKCPHHRNPTLTKKAWAFGPVPNRRPLVPSEVRKSCNRRKDKLEQCLVTSEGRAVKDAFL